MQKKNLMLMLVTLFITQVSFAADTTMNTADPDEATSKQCEIIATACKNAGFVKDGDQGKAFWRDCMKPILFGKTVAGVTVDVKDVRACREFKITNLQNRLEEFKKHRND